MKRIGGLTLALFIGLAMAPMVAQAQAPRDNAFTREAEKQLAFVFTKSDPAARAEYYRAALAAATEGLQENPSHAKLWLLAGEAHVGVGNFTEGLDAYRKAVEFYPDYETEVADKRQEAWVAAYNAGVAHLQANEFDAAAEDLAAAHEFYKGRPEAMAYLGAVHAQLGNIGEAEKYYRETLAFLDSPAAAQATEEERQGWDQYREMAESTLGQLEAAGAVEAYQTGDYDTAIEGFKKLVAQNPFDRDYKFMVFTGLYEKARAMLPETAEMTPEEQAATLDPVFNEIASRGEELVTMDPANSSILQIMAQIRTARSQYQQTEEAQTALRNEALALLERRQALPVFVDQVGVEATAEGAVAVQGGVIGNQAQVGSPITVRMTLVGQGGATVGTKDITVSAPAPGEAAAFQETVQVSGPVLGWKYEIVG